MSNLKSFSGARKALQANLSALLTQFNYTATTFSMRLNQAAFSSGSKQHVASSEEVDAWINGTKLPSLYAIYKITNFFNITIDALLSSEPMDTNLVAGKSFAKQTAASPKVINTTTTTKGTQMATKNNKTANSNTKKMKELIETRTSSREYNMSLAYKILTSDMQLKDIAARVGVSTRSLRDYAYDSASINCDVAKSLASVLKTNTTALGLRLDKETMRYVAV